MLALRQQNCAPGADSPKMKFLSIPSSFSAARDCQFNAEARRGGGNAENSSSFLSPRLCVKILLSALLITSAHAQSGFPFTGEVLKYSVNWPSGLSLGEATFSAQHPSSTGWEFDLTVNAAIPGFTLTDHFKASATADLCSTQFERDVSNGGKKTTEKTTFDQKEGSAHRITTLPKDGGESKFSIPSCARDALTYIYYGRRELGQGRVPQAQTVYYGAPYAVKMDYTGAQNITVAGKSTVTDHLVVTVKGPKSDFNFEVFYARDAARTPMAIRIPLPVGNLSIELVP
jgi:hypothetical protein